MSLPKCIRRLQIRDVNCVLQLGSCFLKMHVLVRVYQGSCRPGGWPALSLADLLC